MIRLPRDVLDNIKGYASDKLPPTPTAKLIKTLKFEYKDLDYQNGMNFPHRLVVTATEGHFDWLDWSEPRGLRIDLVYWPTRALIISNFLPNCATGWTSSANWSLNAN